MPKLPKCGHTQLVPRCKHCAAFQEQWYSKLSGFEDIENTTNPKRPLKTWSGVSIQVTPKDGDEIIDLIDLVVSQSPDSPLQSAFPESLLTNEERLLNHPEFDRICQGMCSHGNHTLKPPQVRSVWEAYIEGGTNRSIAAKLSINDSLVFRTINTLIGWMQTMELDEESTSQDLGTVVMRKFKQDADQAFIYASWRNALWYDKDDRAEGEADRFFRGTTKHIREILSNAQTVVRIACLKGSPNVIIGYSVMNNGYLMFVYVKADYRKEGIATLLCPKVVGITYPLTKIGRAIAVKKGFLKENKNGQEERDSTEPTMH